MAEYLKMEIAANVEIARMENERDEVKFKGT